MSIVFSNTHGWLLDHCSLVDQGFQRCLGAESTDQRQRYFKCRFKRQYFDILKPHIAAKPNSGVEENNVSSLSHIQSSTNGENDTSVNPKTRKRRKRRRSGLNQGELDAQAYHEKVRALVLEGSRSLVEAGRSCGHLNDGVPAVPTQPVPTVPAACGLAALCDMAKMLPVAGAEGQEGVQTVGTAGTLAQLDLFSRVTEHPAQCAREVALMGESYFLPPRCHFLLSDITRTQPLLSGERYDLIILDPPWENKSVKRSSRYSFLPSSQLRQLPVPALSAAGGVVVTWVTNRPRHLRFVREELYPLWGVDLLAQWLWVKVTRAGECVFPLDSQHKKPYEVLLLGRYRGNQQPITRGASEVPLPDQKLIISVPSTLHSHKPSLSAVLRPYISRDAKCLEMFARNLQPDWTSWGNEVLKFQHVSYFTREESEDSPASPPT